MELRPDASLPNAIEGQIIGIKYPLDTAVVAVFAAVALEDLHLITSTDTSGRFHFRDVPAGQHVLLSRAIGYARRVDTVTVTAQFGWRVRLPLPLVCQWPL